MGNGIIPARVPWMTPGNPLQGEPDSADESVFNQGFSRVGGTGRMESAVPTQKRADCQLVGAYQPHQHLDIGTLCSTAIGPAVHAHRSLSTRSRRSSCSHAKI